MNKRNIFIVGFGFLILLGITMGSTYIYLNRHSSCHSQKPPEGILPTHEWAHKIGLTTEQEKKLAPFEAALEKEVQTIQVKLAQERIALCHLIQEEPANSAKVKEYAQKVSSLEAEQQTLVINHLIVMRDIITPEQREKLFSSLMHEICASCRQMVPGQKCICGACDMKGHSHQ